jgi:hypothetical protein
MMIQDLLVPNGPERYIALANGSTKYAANLPIIMEM